MFGTQKKLNFFYRSKNVSSGQSSSGNVDEHGDDCQYEHNIIGENCIQPSRIVDPNFSSVERDPGLRQPIWMYPVNQRDEIRRAYLRFGPYQVQLESFPFSGPQKNHRRFQASWYSEFPWLEYSPTKNAAYCFNCYLFFEQETIQSGRDVFTVLGFNNWKKIGGKNCAFRLHVGVGPCSPHNNAIRNCIALMNQPIHIDKALQKQSEKEIMENRLRVKTSIDVTRWLAFQGLTFRGHDESTDSDNRGNFLELLKYISTYNEDIANVVLNNASGNAKYTSPMIQKEILHVFANKVRSKIREEIGDSKFCIIVDEASDEAKREQMALVLRFVDVNGSIQERFFDLAHVKDISSPTLFSTICTILSIYGLDIQNIRGQGYDGASNMRGEWRGLQALFLNECPEAYYVHCMAHRLQLALVTAAREVHPVHEFFTDLSFIINAIGASCKRHDELQAAQVKELLRKISNDEIETGRGANQIGTLKRAGDTRWSSHFESICSILNMYNACCSVLEIIMKDGSNFKTRGDASAALKKITSFEFIFILHLMKEILGITNELCQGLQQKSQDIVNAMHLVRSTILLIRELRDDGWTKFIDTVILFCTSHDIFIPEFGASHFVGRSSRRGGHVTIEHYYHFDVFNATIDFQLQEIGTRFNERVMELLKLSAALDPRDGYKSFDAEAINTLVKNYYPRDFTAHEIECLKYQLRHFYIAAKDDRDLFGLSSIAELCERLAETQKCKNYPLVDRLFRLILTLPVSTATSERAFSAMKIVKTRLRNKMDDEFLADSLVLYIEKRIAESFDLDCILDDFVSVKERRSQFS